MTAIGFAVLAFVLLAAALVDDEPEWVQVAGGAMALVGAVLLVAGVATWLWRVMP